MRSVGGVLISPLGKLSLASLRGRLIKCQRRRGKGGNITSARWQVTLWVPTWHVSFRSGVATYRTAILVTFKQVVLLQYRQTSQKLSMSSTKITWCIFSLEEKRALTTKELIFLNWQPKCQVNYFKNWNKCSKFGAMHVYSLPKCTEYKYKQLYLRLINIAVTVESTNRCHQQGHVRAVKLHTHTHTHTDTHTPV